MSVSWPEKLEYYLGELRIVEEVGNPLRSMPPFAVTGDVLDVGCGIGQTLTAPELQGAKSLHGIDINAEAIEHGSKQYPRFRLSCAPAEAIPYPDRSFDVVFSRVSIPYTDIPRALKEIRRVVRRDGRVWLSLHGHEIERMLLSRARHPKALLHRVYVWANSLAFNVFGFTFRRPGSDITESMQTKRGISKALERAGFTDIEFKRTPREFSVSATPLRVRVQVFKHGAVVNEG